MKRAALSSAGTRGYHASSSVGLVGNPEVLIALIRASIVRERLTRQHTKAMTGAAIAANTASPIQRLVLVLMRSGWLKMDCLGAASQRRAAQRDFERRRFAGRQVDFVFCHVARFHANHLLVFVV